jgi:hypothetical protein
MTIKIWRCFTCLDNPLCIQSYDPNIIDAGSKKPTVPDTCPYGGYESTAEFELLEVDETELIKLFTNKGEHYYSIAGCELNHGICPKTSNGECDSTCEVIKRINRSS